ncbi:TraH [Bacteroides sp. 3_1_23]|nr:TraH [Bacteroides thetaiotaomicron]EFI37376.1 TraH [Bacteroides sp. 3_1_23]
MLRRSVPKSIWRTPPRKRRKWRFTVWRRSWAATSKPPSGNLPKSGETRKQPTIKNEFINEKRKMRMNLPKVKMLQVSKCLIGLAVMMLQSCDVADNLRDMLCGNWESVEGKPDVLIYKEGEAYKVTVFRRSGLRRKLKPETYLLQEENGNLFMNTGFRIDVSYNEATDVLTFSPNGDYVRVKPQPENQTEE